MPTIEEQAELIRSEASDKYQAVRNNPRISDIETRDQIARAWVESIDKLRALEAAHGDTTAGEKQNLERKLYGLTNDTDPSLAISYRDALDRASNTPDNDERPAIALLNRALTSNDTTLARAILAVAFERMHVDVINAYSNAVPTATEDIEKLWAKLTNRELPLFTFVSPISPPELGNQHEIVIRTWADGNY
jgi:hypothetical protein